MQLGELKKALAKFPPDMHDMEVGIQIARDGKTQYELLCFVGYAEKIQCFMLGGESAVQKMIADGEMSGDGYKPTSETGFLEPPQ